MALLHRRTRTIIRFLPACVEDGNQPFPLAFFGARPGYKEFNVTDVTFATLGVAEPILRALAQENYTIPTPIQSRAIPALLGGRDLLGIAQTGTGKTAAFGLPLLQKLSVGHVPPRPKEAKALILAPTRELAVQIEQVFAPMAVSST